LELPILFGAVFLVNIAAPFVYSELWLSILSLALACLFVIIGSGPLSLDRLLLKSKTFGEE
jgi:putative oxidoreductase